MIKKFSAQKEMIYVQNVGDPGFDSGTVYKPMQLYLFRMKILTILIMLQFYWSCDLCFSI